MKWGGRKEERERKKCEFFFFDFFFDLCSLFFFLSLSLSFKKKKKLSFLPIDAAPGSPRHAQIASCAPCDCSSSGTLQMFLTSCIVSTCEAGTWQKSASLSRTAGSSGASERQARKLGAMPSERSTLTECCVGLVFCSPTTPRTGTSETCTEQKLSAPTR